jgi:predicted CxxxxCH...CXXCH cytochrome family protein
MDQDRPAVLIVLLTLLAVFALSCSQLDDTITEPQPRTLEVHPAGWIDPPSPAFHGKEIRSQGWQMESCLKCHGNDYRGGIAEVSCLTCHENTPEDCTTCHGGLVDDLPAPPPDIDGNTESTARGVGAHTHHLEEGELRVAVECSSCHRVPSSVYQAGHVDSDLPAEVVFSGLAVADSAKPTWDGESCSNVYCHGNFELGNKDNAPIWTLVDGSQAECGTCHGLPPPEPHPQIALCQVCHSAVVDADREIIDKTKHINGQTDFSASTSNR